MINKKTQNLLQLIKENPELPIVPMVDAEIPGDDSGWWLGSWGNAYVGEYLLTNGSEDVMFKNDDDVFGVLDRCLSEEDFENLPETEEECRGAYNALPWIKAIIVTIDLPD